MWEAPEEAIIGDRLCVVFGGRRAVRVGDGG